MGVRKSGVRQQRGREKSPRSLVGWTLVAVVGLGLVLLFTTTGRAGASHPEPRAMDHAGHVVGHERYEAYPRVAQVYQQAAAVPAVLDGLYCYCECSEHSAHYSLLDCFASDHAARCDVCLSEASIAHRMTRDGASLEQIRAAIDDLYGTSG